MQILRTPVPNRRIRGIVPFLGLLLVTSGCAICPSPYDDDYGGFVTKTPRSDMRTGRVGSVFSDPQMVGEEASEVIVFDDGSAETLEIPVPDVLDD